MPVAKVAQDLVRTVTVLTRSGLLAPLRPDKYLRMAATVSREAMNATTGITLASVRCPNRIALVDERGTLTWAELESRVNALAAGVTALPGGPPGTIALLCRNHRGFVEAMAAAGKVGADVLLLNTGFAGPQLSEVLAREGADLIVLDEEFVGLLPEDSEIDRVLGWVDSAEVDVPTLDGLIEAHAGQRVPVPDEPGRIVLLTSGTTGTPKGAKRGAGGDVSILVSMLDRIPWRAEENVVIAAPMFHGWGFAQLMLAATMSCTMIMRRRFDPEATMAMVATHRATGLGVVPVMLERIVDLPDEVRRRYDLSSLRFVTASGSRMRPDAVTTFLDEVGDVVYNSYNATESGMITIAGPGELRIAADTAGRAVEGTEVLILDEANEPVPAGEVGRIFARNSMGFDGYTNGETKPFHDGAMATGDLGRLDENGLLFVVGRDDEMIVSGGENVYPQEVEDTLAEHDGVQEAAVVGVDDAKFGQRLEAFVVLVPGAGATPDELKKHVKDNLAGYKVPRSVTVLDELPRGTTGKVLKRELIEQAGAS